MVITYGNLNELFETNCIGLDHTFKMNGEKFTTFLVSIEGKVNERAWNESGKSYPKRLEGLELVAKGWLNGRSEITPENIVSIKRVIRNRYAGYYSYINESENLLQVGRYPIRID